jgi:hypothetical protein
MDHAMGVLTVVYEEPFWVGVYVRRTAQRVEVARLFFDGEPDDGEVYDRLTRHFNGLRFGPLPAGSALRIRPPPGTVDAAAQI